MTPTWNPFVGVSSTCDGMVLNFVSIFIWVENYWCQYNTVLGEWTVYLLIIYINVYTWCHFSCHFSNSSVFPSVLYPTCIWHNSLNLVYCVILIYCVILNFSSHILLVFFFQSWLFQLTITYLYYFTHCLLCWLVHCWNDL